jgi:dipeptidyl aminopeptidase/acylaminoacyl peptidase
MDGALRSAGKRSELIEFPGLEHDLGDSSARTRMLDRIAAFLSAELAGH